MLQLVYIRIRICYFVYEKLIFFLNQLLLDESLLHLLLLPLNLFLLTLRLSLLILLLIILFLLLLLLLPPPFLLLSFSLRLIWTLLFRLRCRLCLLFLLLNLLHLPFHLPLRLHFLLLFNRLRLLLGWCLLSRFLCLLRNWFLNHSPDNLLLLFLLFYCGGRCLIGQVSPNLRLVSIVLYRWSF